MLYKESDIDRSNKNFAVTIKDYLDKNYSDRRISMNFLVGLVGYSDVRIHDVFKKHYGITPIEYLQKLRLEKAKELITLGVPIGMASYKVGYGSQRTFYRVFTKYTGMSPGEFKETAMQNYADVTNVVKNYDTSPIEYARKMCDTVMFENDPSKLPPCFVDLPQSRYSYVQGMFLLGMFRVYEALGDVRYINYIGEWINTVIDEEGYVNETYEHPRCLNVAGLDKYQPLLLLMKYNEMFENGRCTKAVSILIDMLKKHKTTKMGIYTQEGTERSVGVFLNGVYMLCPTISLYAKVNDLPKLFEVAVNQIIAINANVRDKETGLLYHAYDETMSEEWADPETGLSDSVWGRGMGYFIMGILDTLDYLPEKHNKRKVLVDIVKNALIAIVPYQDKTGKWYQLLEKNTLEGNWCENSCSCMFAYSFAKAINVGILGIEYSRVALSAYSAVIDSVVYDENGCEMYLSDICEGMMAGVPGYYLEANRKINDLHGIGAFVNMCSEVEKLLKNL